MNRQRRNASESCGKNCIVLARGNSLFHQAMQMRPNQSAEQLVSAPSQVGRMAPLFSSDAVTS